MLITLLPPDFTPAFFVAGASACYFPTGLQGDFITQSLSSLEIAYHGVRIGYNSISGLGRCHRHIGHNVVLDNGPERGPSCFRCVRITSRSANVVQLHTLDDACHATEREALALCPQPAQVRARVAKESMLYKTASFTGGPAITKTYCPVNGRFRFTYSINDGTEDDQECSKGESDSTASDCPSGYKFDLKFKGCSFPDFGKTKFRL